MDKAAPPRTFKDDVLSEVALPAHPYYQAALDDLNALDAMYQDGFRFPAEACIMMARISEELLKTKMMLRGADYVNIIDQCVLMSELGIDFDDPLMYIGRQFNEYIIMSYLPYNQRKTITSETAKESYNDLFRLIDRLREMEPVFHLPTKAVKRRGIIGTLKNY